MTLSKNYHFPWPNQIPQLTIITWREIFLDRGKPAQCISTLQWAVYSTWAELYYLEYTNFYISFNKIFYYLTGVFFLSWELVFFAASTISLWWSIERSLAVAAAPAMSSTGKTGSVLVRTLNDLLADLIRTAVSKGLSQTPRPLLLTRLVASENGITRTKIVWLFNGTSTQ